MQARIRICLVIAALIALPTTVAMGRPGDGGNEKKGGAKSGFQGGGNNAATRFPSRSFSAPLKQNLSGVGNQGGADSSSGAAKPRRSFNAPVGPLQSGKAGGPSLATPPGGQFPLGKGGSNASSFMRKQFPNQGSGNQTFTAPNSEALQRIKSGRLDGNLSNRVRDDNDSFLRKQNITSTDPNHWTHDARRVYQGPASVLRSGGHDGDGPDRGDGDRSGRGRGDWTGSNPWNWNWRSGWNDPRHHNGHHGNSIFVYPWIGGFGLYGGWGWPYNGWGYGYGYPLYASSFYGYPYYSNYTTIYAAAPAGAPAAQNQLAQNQLDPAAAAGFAEQGEVDFKAARYDAAARDWQHALVDDPQNGAIMMLLAQTLFALGKYNEAAGATQTAMQMLPEDKWGVVIENYAELYGNVQDYTDQLKALEKSRDEQPDAPALRFLLGYQFGYLGYPKHAVRELDQGLELAPEDFGAQKVRGIFAAQWPEAPPLPAAAAAAAKEFEKQQQQGAPAARPPAGDQPSKPGPTPQDDVPGTPS